MLWELRVVRYITMHIADTQKPIRPNKHDEIKTIILKILIELLNDKLLENKYGEITLNELISTTSWVRTPDETAIWPIIILPIISSAWFKPDSDLVPAILKIWKNKSAIIISVMISIATPFLALMKSAKKR